MATPIPQVDIYNVVQLRFRRRLSMLVVAVLFAGTLAALYLWRVSALENASLDRQIAQLNTSFQERTTYLTGLIEVLESEFFGKRAVNLNDDQRQHLSNYRQRLVKQKKVMERDQINAKIRYIAKNVRETRSKAIAASILKWAKASQIDPDMLIALTFIESRFNPNSRSHKGALGLTQVMPMWVGCKNPRDICKQLSFLKTREDLNDVDKNIRAGAIILKYYLKQAKGKWDFALASYNMGWGRIDKDILAGKDLDYGYAKKVLRVYTRLKQSIQGDSRLVISRPGPVGQSESVLALR